MIYEIGQWMVICCSISLYAILVSIYCSIRDRAHRVQLMIKENHGRVNRNPESDPNPDPDPNLECDESGWGLL